jgi:HEAT repeat protein
MTDDRPRAGRKTAAELMAELRADPEFRARRCGEARQMVVLGLAKLTKDKRAVPVLLALLDDPDVTGSAIMALGKLKAVKARDRLQQFLDHPEPFYRTEARKALNKIK